MTKLKEIAIGAAVVAAIVGVVGVLAMIWMHDYDVCRSVGYSIWHCLRN